MEVGYIFQAVHFVSKFHLLMYGVLGIKSLAWNAASSFAFVPLSDWFAGWGRYFIYSVLMCGYPIYY